MREPSSVGVNVKKKSNFEPSSINLLRNDFKWISRSEEACFSETSDGGTFKPRDKTYFNDHLQNGRQTHLVEFGDGKNLLSLNRTSDCDMKQSQSVNFDTFRSRSRSARYRYRPYFSRMIPLKRQIKQKGHNSFDEKEYINKLKSIQVNNVGDFDFSSERKHSSKRCCGVCLSTETGMYSDDEGIDGHVNELALYFSHFVNVTSKMPAHVRNMYE